MFGLAACVALGAAVVQAKTYTYVDQTLGNDANGGTSWDDAVKTFERALSINDTQAWSEGGREIVLKPGTYTLTNTVFVGDTGQHLFFSMRSFSGNPADTIIDAERKRPIYHESGWQSGQVFSGITFRNGFRDGKVYTTDSAMPESAGLFFKGTTLTNCIVENCLSTCYDDAGASGAGIKTQENHTYGMTPKIYDSIIRNNVISNYSSKDACGSANGAGIVIRGGIIRNSVVSNNWIYLDCPKLTTYNKMNVDRGQGAGIFDPNDYGSFISDSLICGNVTTNMGSAGYGGRGGGLVLSSYTTVSNCLISGNSASCTAGGILGGKLVTHCTISNNVVATKQAANFNYLAGGGASVSGTMRNCRVVGNRITKSATKYGGGGIHLSGAAQILDCVIENNVSTHGGALSACSIGGSSARGAMVSNCLVRCNHGTTESGVLQYYGPDGVLITDCSIVGNLAGANAFCWGYTAGANVAGITVRNCYIGSNTNDLTTTYSDGFFGGQLSCSYHQPLVVEYCTIAKNFSGWYLVKPTDYGCASNFFLRGCAVYENRHYKSQSSICQTFANFTSKGVDITLTTNVLYTVSDSTTGVSTNPDCHNVPGATAADFAFRDAAKGDYRPTKNSQLVDVGDDMRPWMTTRRSCLDMGDGTMTVTAVGGYGVNVTRNNPSRRVSGTSADAGCFELYQPSGLVILFR